MRPATLLDAAVEMEFSLLAVTEHPICTISPQLYRLILIFGQFKSFHYLDLIRKTKNMLKTNRIAKVIKILRCWLTAGMQI